MKLADYIMEKYVGEINEADGSDELMDAFLAFLDTIDPDKLDDKQLEAYDTVMAMFDDMEDSDDEEEDDEEEVSEIKRVRVDRRERKKHKIYYKQNKAKIKSFQKKYRKTAAFKKMIKLRKKRVKMGKVTKYI
jgi:hypothetical protein